MFRKMAGTGIQIRIGAQGTNFSRSTSLPITITSIPTARETMNVPGLHRPTTPPGMPPPSAHRKPSKLSFGTVCSSNINRSMEAHVVLQNAGESERCNDDGWWCSCLMCVCLIHIIAWLIYFHWNICNLFQGMRVESYGTGTQVRLPGKSAMEPRIFKFGTPYAEMYRSLAATPEDEAFFVHNGVLQLCKRGSSVKVWT